jgi:hypothetical protein
MREIHNARGSASGHYNDRGGKSGGDEERGWERDRYNERDRKLGWQSDAPSARDQDRERGSAREREYTQTWRPSKLFNHVNELNKQILNSRGCRATNDRNKERDRNKDCQRSRDRPRDSDRDCVSDRDRQYTLTQRPSKQFNIEQAAYENQ